MLLKRKLETLAKTCFAVHNEINLKDYDVLFRNSARVY